MRTFLLTNDDGFNSEGLLALREELKNYGRVVVVAPDRNLSGVGHSLTFKEPLRMKELEEDFFVVMGGTPADCIHLGYFVVLNSKKPDMVVSGINLGPNLGEDITYSGTVSGAMEGRILGIKSVALSLFGYREGETDFKEVSQVAVSLIQKICQMEIPEDTYLNINIPNLPKGEIRGVKITRMGRRNYQEKVFKYYDPYGNPFYWIAAQKFDWEREEGTDFWAVSKGYISITPLQLDLTNYRALKTLKESFELYKV